MRSASFVDRRASPSPSSELSRSVSPRPRLCLRWSTMSCSGRYPTVIPTALSLLMRSILRTRPTSTPCGKTSWHGNRKAILLINSPISGRMSGRNLPHSGGDALQVSGTSASARTSFRYSECNRRAWPHLHVAEPVSSTPGKMPGTVVLSDAVWTQSLNADPSIVGKSVTINNTSYTVVAVMPPGFEFQSARHVSRHLDTHQN